jgi:hypothetical protein
MTSTQLHKFHVFTGLSTFLDKNSAVWSGFTRLTDEIAKFNAILLQIQDAHGRQKITRLGITKQKKRDRKNMTTLLVKYAGLARAWAFDTRNSALLQIFTVSNRHLLNGPASIALSKATNIAKALADNIGSLAPYQVLPGNITAVNAALNTFKLVQVAPASARANASAATLELRLLFQKADTSLLLISKLLSQYNLTHPELVKQFAIQHRLGKPNVRHTGISVHVTRAGSKENPEGIELHIIELKKKTVSDLNGIAKIISCKPGTYHVELSAPGLKTITITQKFTRGHIVVLEVEMEAE